LLLFFRKEDLPFFLAAADEHRVQDFNRAQKDKARRRINPERGVHLSSRSAADGSREGTVFFSEEKKQKTFANLGVGAACARRGGIN
jgi:hypothetical protein